MLYTNGTSQNPSISMLMIQGGKKVILFFSCFFCAKLTSVPEKQLPEKTYQFQISYNVMCMYSQREICHFLWNHRASFCLPLTDRKKASSNHADYEAGLRPHEAITAGMRSWHIPTSKSIDLTNQAI